ncbi:unnamed protein product [Anisakis simplex]|uniref:GDNF domain-containing protein n=1 Tax=Anisakis simplex TaxID=6269 RepID=A0A0M3K2W0_ANISI|nr:unnamed protein product [Anisakis simplex]
MPESSARSISNSFVPDSVASCISAEIAAALGNKAFSNQASRIESDCAQKLSSPLLLGLRSRAMTKRVRDCVAAGGILPFCSSRHGDKNCTKWFEQCSKTYEFNVTVTKNGTYKRLPRWLASCILTKDVRTECLKRMNKTKCDELENRCAGDVFDPDLLNADQLLCIYGE